jgi:hypothetical protein
MYNKIGSLLKKIAPECLKNVYRKIKLAKTKKLTTKEIFTSIKVNNSWGNSESVSGPGSAIRQSETLIVELSKLIKEKYIKTFLDIPCGDFNWMCKVDFSDINYIGGDIVDEIIKENIKKYETINKKFITIDIIKDSLPKSDIIFVRDCFVHLSYKNIFEAFENIKKSGSKYLLTTTFTARNKNYDIVTGDWRPLNLQIEPFKFPKPENIIIENCTEGEGRYKDKSVGIWDIKNL